LKKPRGVLVTGATGLIGQRLLPKLVDRFAWVRTLSRTGRAPLAGVEARTWDGTDPGPTGLDGVDTIVHLAGEPIFGGLPTASRLERIRRSRLDSTNAIVDRILERGEDSRPKSLICASAVGIYAESENAPLDEAAEVGDGFLSKLCVDWEAAAARAVEAGVRVAHMRTGVVLAREGGALALMKLPFSMGAGGRLGDGKQYFPWIHGDDLVRALLFCVDEPIVGAVNGVAPGSVRNIEFTKTLGDVLSRPTILPVPAFAIRAALGEISGELLGSRRVVPARLEDAGFKFDHPMLRSALEAELR